MFQFFRRIKSLLSGISTVSFSLGEPYYSAQSYYTFVKEGYNKNPILYGTLNFIARNIATLKWILYNDDENNENRQRIQKSPSFELINKPDARMSKSEFFKRIVIHYLVEGDAFIFKNIVGNSVKELNILRPDRCTINGNMLTFTKDDGSFVKYPMELIIRIQNFNPLDDCDGLSPLAPASRSVDVNNAGRQWNFSLLKNMIKSGTWFETDDVKVRNVKGLGEKLQQLYGGDKNVGKNIVLTGGLKMKQAGFSPIDMDWMNSQDRSAWEILQALNFPPELMGRKSTFDNFEQATKAFWNECAIPIAKEIRDSFNKDLLPHFGKSLFFDIDTASINALKEDEDKKINKVMSKYHGGVITHSEARAELNYAPMKRGDVQLLYSPPMGLNNSETEIPKIAILDKETKARYRKRYQVMESYRERFLKYFTEVSEKQFKSEHERVAKIFEIIPIESVYHRVDEIIHKEFNGEWSEKLVEFHIRVMNTIGQQEMDALLSMKKSSKDFKVIKFDPYLTSIQQRIRNAVAEKVRYIGDGTRLRIKKQIDDGIEDGLSISEIAKNIDTLYLDSIIPNRSEVIAQTETISTTNFASQEVAKQTGLKIKKFWISSLDGRTRGSNEKDEFDHVHAREENGEIDIDEPYIVSKEKLMYPGDVSLGASAGNVINCRCAEGYRPVD